MKLSDPVFYYHSVNGKAVVGLAKVTKEVLAKLAIMCEPATEPLDARIRGLNPSPGIAQLAEQPRSKAGGRRLLAQGFGFQSWR
jgi:hypothetical protein